MEDKEIIEKNKEFLKNYKSNCKCIVNIIDKMLYYKKHLEILGCSKSKKAKEIRSKIQNIEIIYNNKLSNLIAMAEIYEKEMANIPLEEEFILSKSYIEKKPAWWIAEKIFMSEASVKRKRTEILKKVMLFNKIDTI